MLLRQWVTRMEPSPEATATVDDQIPPAYEHGGGAAEKQFVQGHTVDGDSGEAYGWRGAVANVILQSKSEYSLGIFWTRPSA